MRGFLLLGALFLTATVTRAATWHVSPERLRSVPARNQFRTIQQAANVVETGDIVRIHSGVYREAVAIRKSGTAQKPIRFEAAPGAKVIITGLNRLTVWRKESANVFSTRWTHHFIPSSKYEAHPDDQLHRLIGRAEQLVMRDRLLRQTLERDQLSPGSFYVDLVHERLYVCTSGGDDPRSRQVRVEAATRSLLLDCKGAYLTLRGIDFRYAANPAQTGALAFRGRGDTAEDCVFEQMNGAGAAFVGLDQVARGCTFQDNGQLGFAANHAHNLLITGCTIRNNNIKGFNRQWEAGGDKIVLSRNVVLENSRFVSNHGSGIWFDIGNENCEVRNCLIADNEDGGIFYEISYGLHAHDNVITGNGFASTAGAWGAQAGIVLSSSPNCVVERNLIVGNREGFNFREQVRTTPRIENSNAKQEEPIWNHDERICNNVMADNRDAQTRGWFDMTDERHWPRKLQSAPASTSLEALGIAMTQNIYARDNNEPLFIWGAEWRRHASYSTIAEIQSNLGFEQGSQLLPLKFSSLKERDFRLPRDSPVFQMDCYPPGHVPDVKLGPE